MKVKLINIFLIVLIFLALIVSLSEAWTRHQVERGNRNTEILLEYGELFEYVHRHSLGHFTVREALETFHHNGVRGVLFKEQSLSDLAQLGELRVFCGAEIRAASLQGFTSGDLINPYHLYLEISDQALWDRVAFHMGEKVPGTVVHRHLGTTKEMKFGEDIFLASTGILSLPLTLEELEEIGAGFPVSVVEEVASTGMNIYLQLFNWRTADKKSIPAVLASLDTLPGVKGVLFNAHSIPGVPAHTVTLASELRRRGLPLVTIDLFEMQRGPLSSLVRASSEKEVIRLHAIPQFERDLLSRERALGRYILAASERNNRLLLIRYGGEKLFGEPWLDENTLFIQDLQTRLLAADLPAGEVIPYNSADFTFSRVKIFIICAGILAGGVLLLRRLGMPRLGLLIGVCGLFLVGLLLVMGGKVLGINGIDLVRKGMALGSGIIFPLLGLAYYREHFGKMSLPKALAALLGLSSLSLIGALLATGLVTEMAYLVKLDQLQGVRLALILPLVLFWLFFITGEKNSLRERIRTLSDLFERPLVTGSVVLAVLLVTALVIALNRSGNESIFVMDLELRARFFLDQLLAIRPRTKEFLIGHPFMLVALYWGFQRRFGFLAVILGLVGQVSLVNTFYHLHTPLAISLQRTAWGLALGIVLGFALIFVIKIIYPYYNRHFIK